MDVFKELNHKTSVAVTKTNVIPQIYKMLEFKNPFRTRKNAAEMAVALADKHGQTFIIDNLLGLI